MITVCILLVLSVLSYQDIKYMEVQDRYFVLLACLCLMDRPKIYLTSSLILICFLCLCYLAYRNDKIGGADLKFYAIFGLYLPLYVFFYSILISTSFALSVCFLTNKKKIPFIPCMSIGIFLALFIQKWLIL